ncbi:Na+/H+ antiporter NhaA [Mangrovihabitans endophyticus]|uniref:Na(+)/H(+) antiporter NhaA n=1 Tax=Mangrovihabitans endophyticus TaxID=1751298 RepID=A0A8J3C2E9_9ACTN|nr:Na+/H+ antiporter NhaA [Mangrovihabitans endophyticus]GGK99881.1 Na(+)/H(+) antiporter NhaA [Mangrovihabitans endophyticus]
MGKPLSRTPRLFGSGSWAEARRVGDVLRTETVGGVLLLGAALIALVWANTPLADSYHRLSEARIGPSAWHLDLSLTVWAADGLLAIFFFVAGLELKREFVGGDLRDPRRAALPVAAAVGGMAVPALIFAAVAARGGGDALAGWAIPTATDIAFALAVLGVISTHLPTSLRTFLLTLAVVDDLLAILVIAVFYSSSLHLLPLALAVLPIAAFGLLVQRRVLRWWLLIPLAVVAWALVHESGIHATVAGVLLAFTVPVRGRDSEHGMAERLEHAWRPVSAGVAVPVFAFFAAGVSVADTGGFGASLAQPITLGIIAGLVLGKAIGITGSAWLVQRFTHARLADGLSWWDVFGLALLGGVGFTVSLLIGELAFGIGSDGDGYAKIGVLTGSLLAAVFAAIVLRVRNSQYRKLCAQEEADADGDGVPDIYQGQRVSG